MYGTSTQIVVDALTGKAGPAQKWAALYFTRLLIELTPKGLVFSFLSHTKSHAGLYVSDPWGRHVAAKCMNAQMHEKNRCMNAQMPENNQCVNEQMRAPQDGAFCSHRKCGLGCIHSCV